MKYITANLFRPLLRLALAVVLVAASVANSGATELLLGTARSQRSSGDILPTVLTGPIQRTVSMGGGHTLAVDEDGRLWAWGKNDKGQIGDGSTENRNAPVQIKADTVWLAVAAGANFSLAIDDGGRLWAWGSNSTGQLGDGTTFDSIVPKQVKVKRTGAPDLETGWRAISAGDLHVLAINENDLYAWGSNTMGQLGKDPVGNWSTTPTYSYVPILAFAGPWLSVAAGGAHSVGVYGPDWPVGGVTYRKTIRTWGANNRGQLNRITDGNYDFNIVWDGISSVGSSDIRSVAAGGEFTVLLNDSIGRVYAFGDNTFGQLALSAGTPQSTIVTVIAEKAVAISAGKHHAVALIDGTLGSDDTVVAWGRRTSGQVPADAGPGPSPVLIDVGGAGPLGIAAGEQGSLAVLGTGAVLTIGRNIEGQHGDGIIQQSLEPQQKLLKQWSQVVVGERHTLAIDSNGKLWAWGDNSASQLGTGSTTASSAPVSPDGEAGTWKAVAVSANNSAAIRSDDALFVWGTNFNGQIGNGSAAAVLVPVQVPGTWKAVALGATHTLGIKLDGSLWAWGSNSSAQLGSTKNNVNQLVPKRVGTSSSWEKVAAGDNHSLGLQSGSLYAWGANILGQLGNGNNNDLSAPTKIGSKSWKAISAAGSNSAAIDNADNLWVWGSNNNGQLGIGGTQPANSPKALLGTQAVRSVSVASSSMGAVTFGGSLYMWGFNEDGRLGDGTTINRSKPVLIAGSYGSVALGGGAGSALNIGNLIVWGSNKYGQLNESANELLAGIASMPRDPIATISAAGDTISVVGVSGNAERFDYAEGELIRFVANPSGTGPYTYQWYKGDAEITGAKGPVYEVAGSSSMDGAAYTVLVSSPYGGPTASNAIVAYLWEAPVITEAPTAQGVLVGGTASLSVQASGTNLTYAWTPSTVPVTTTYYTPFVAATGPVTYTINVSNTRNTILQSGTASAVVTGYDQIILEPANQAAFKVGSGIGIQFDRQAGASLTLEVVAANGEAYQWRRDLVEISGATSRTYSLPTLTALSGGYYDVVVSNGASSVTSKPAVVRIYSAPVFTRHPTSQTVAIDKTATLTASAVGYNTPTLVWYGPNGIIPTATPGVLVLANFSASNYGAYYVAATNALGTVVSETATLSAPGAVDGKPLIQGALLGQSVTARTTATFSVNASDATQYQWRKNGVAIPGANSNVLTVSNVGSTDYAAYSVVVSNSMGSVTSAPALLSSRSDVDGDDRRTIFNSAVGLNGGLYAGRFKVDADPAVLPAGLEEGYIRLNVTRVGTVSGVYTNGLNQYRFGGRFSFVDGQWVTSISLAGGSAVLRVIVKGDASAPVVSAQVQLNDVTAAPLTLARQGIRDSSLAPVYTGAYQNSLTGSLVGVVSTRVNPTSGMVVFTGALPDGGRLSGTSAMYADPAGIQPAMLSDLILRLSATKRVFSTLALSPESFVGDASVVTADGTNAYDLTGAAYTAAPSGGLLSPFVSVRDQAVVNWVRFDGFSEVSTELGRFSASGSRLLPLGSAFASSGGRFSLTFAPTTGQVTGFVSFGGTGAERTPRRFTGVILQGGYRLNGGLLGIGITDTGEAIRFEPAN